MASGAFNNRSSLDGIRTGAPVPGNPGATVESGRIAPQIREAMRNEIGSAENDPMFEELENGTLSQDGLKGAFNRAASGVRKGVIYLWEKLKMFRFIFSNLNFMAEDQAINELHK